jgi:pilus assembly protein CpaC
MKSTLVLRTIILALALATFPAGLEAAPQQEITPPATPAAPAIPVVPAREVAPTEGQALHILVGKSVVVNVQTPITRVLSSNPTVIETLATSPTQLVVEGKAAGAGSLILWDGTGRSQLLDVVVDLDISGLRSAIERSSQNVDVQVNGGRVFLTGNVPDAHAAEDLVKMAGAYSAQVVNSLSVAVPHERQVLLEVKIAEVDRSRLTNFGINVFSTGAANTIGTISTQQFGAPTISGTVPPTSQTTTTGSVTTTTGSNSVIPFNFTDLLNVFLFRPDINLGATIKALQQQSVLEILAEPNLMAISGQKASFLAGGEFPFPVIQGGANVGAVTIQFRPFGVRLDFTGVVQSDNVIRLHVAPEVSSLDFTNAVTISGFTIPALSTRKAETEIELKDGQSFGIAGLLDHRATVLMSKFPGLGDLPILGQFFKSKSTNRSNSELMVLVTAHIVDPVRVGLPVPEPPKPPIPFLDPPTFDKKMPESNKDLGTSQTPSAK